MLLGRVLPQIVRHNKNLVSVIGTACSLSQCEQQWKSTSSNQRIPRARHLSSLLANNLGSDLLHRSHLLPSLQSPLFTMPRHSTAFSTSDTELPKLKGDPFWLFKPKLWFRGQRPPLTAVFPLIWISVAGWIFVLFLTTTAVSILVLVSRTLGFQKWLLEHVCNYIAKEMGVSITIEEADVKGWVDGCVVLSKVTIKPIPQPEQASSGEREAGEESGDSCDEVPDEDAPADAVFSGTRLLRWKRAKAEETEQRVRVQPWLELDLQIEELSMRLSLFKHSRGIVRTLHAKKVRGYVDTRGFAQKKSVIPWVEYDLDECSMEDCEVNVCSDELQQPVRLSVYRASFDRVRDRWLLFDILTANYIEGALNDALFSCRRLSSLDPPSRSSSTGNQRYFEHEGNYATYDFRFDKVPLDLLSSKIPDSSPLSSLVAGTTDLRLRVQFPILHKYICFDSSDVLYDQEVRINAHMDMRNLLAVLPYSFPELPSYSRYQFSSVVNYMNAHTQHIPLDFSFRGQLSSFRNVHFLTETGLYGELAQAAVDQMKGRIEQTNLAADPDFIPFVVTVGFDWFEFLRTVGYGILAS